MPSWVVKAFMPGRCSADGPGWWWWNPQSQRSSRSQQQGLLAEARFPLIRSDRQREKAQDVSGLLGDWLMGEQHVNPLISEAALLAFAYRLWPTLVFWWVSCDMQVPKVGVDVRRLDNLVLPQGIALLIPENKIISIHLFKPSGLHPLTTSPHCQRQFPVDSWRGDMCLL